MGWTILNLVCFAIGCRFTKAILDEAVDGKALVIGNIITGLTLGFGTKLPWGITFLVTSTISLFLGAIFLERKNGRKFGDEQKAWNAQQAAKARANPTLAMLDSINLIIQNNSPSVSLFGSQQSDTDDFTQQRLNTMGDIRAGRAPNGTNGVWLKD